MGSMKEKQERRGEREGGRVRERKGDRGGGGGEVKTLVVHIRHIPVFFGSLLRILMIDVKIIHVKFLMDKEFLNYSKF